MRCRKMSSSMSLSTTTTTATTTTSNHSGTDKTNIRKNYPHAQHTHTITEEFRRNLQTPNRVYSVRSFPSFAATFSLATRMFARHSDTAKIEREKCAKCDLQINFIHFHVPFIGPNFANLCTYDSDKQTDEMGRQTKE